MSIPDRTPHALHNEDLCNHLIGTGQYDDWVVTTAFYAALHFVQSKMFPMNTTNPYTGAAVTLNNFPTYFSLFKSFHNKSKHAVTLLLVSSELPAAYNSYKRLYDACMSARYSNYNVSNALATLAKTHLDAIKTECIPPVAPVTP